MSFKDEVLPFPASRKIMNPFGSMTAYIVGSYVYILSVCMAFDRASS